MTGSSSRSIAAATGAETAAVYVPPRPPAGLAAAGRALWRGLVAEYQFDPVELLVLHAAAAQADSVAALEKLVREHGIVTTGSKGQPRLSAAVAELRQGRLALARLLGDLAIPVDDALGATTSLTQAGRRAQRAARARWARRGSVS